MGKAGVFVDDIISITADVGNNLLKIKAAACTVIHAVAHNAQETCLPHQELIADDKNEVEGAPEETKICLGWLLDMRRLLVCLPCHKYLAWNGQIQELCNRKSVQDSEL
jgi:hypothetical protein